MNASEQKVFPSASLGTGSTSLNRMGNVVSEYHLTKEPSSKQELNPLPSARVLFFKVKTLTDTIRVILYFKKRGKTIVRIEKGYKCYLLEVQG